ncbi:uncharacterized protein Ecym_7139 [Eremothecium cymbalariae DBVPG|uniref:C2 NT-type domain-containing protein n=1 Tax=Eremothecium cymbalariae (strain CBS 270.75 / DBVPG 7215 / KCTC 17166 / NRRL Y-17582) TaxID=931890 RepID=G8JVX3_ERECY|nr:hypothetical protein Ecym_7139 [Eremothecium cymbalariae DBVPG\
MSLFNAKNKNRRPKFLLYLEVKELSNIPQSSGYCYVKWHLKDGTGTSSYHDKGSKDVAGNHVPSSNQSKGSTLPVMVKNHKAQWNYRLESPARVKMFVDKDKNLCSKVLMLDIYFEFLDSEGLNGKNVIPSPNSSITSNHNITPSSATTPTSTVYTKKVSGKLLLGAVSTDLVEYVNGQQTATTKRLLLQKSKINSILTINIQMQLIRGTYDDFNLPLSIRPAGNSRIGLNEMFEETASDFASPVISIPHPSRASSPSISVTSALHHTATSPLRRLPKYDGLLSMTFSNPLIEKLYQKTFQVSWDRRPGEFTPRECVEDIIDGGDGWAKNELGLNVMDLQFICDEDGSKINYMHSTPRPLLDPSSPPMLIMPTPRLAVSHTNKNILSPEARDDWELLSARQRKQIRAKCKRGLSLKALKSSEEDNVDASVDETSPQQLKDDRSWKINHILP